MSETEQQAIVNNTVPHRADVSASWAKDLEIAKGMVQHSPQSVATVSSAIEEYLTSQGHTVTRVVPPEDEDPPLTPDQAVKAASDVAAFLGAGGEDSPAEEKKADDEPLSDVDRDVLRYFGRSQRR